jgi:hypothetical protein
VSLLAQVRERDLLLCSDEAYSELWLDGPVPSALQAGVENVLVFQSPGQYLVQSSPITREYSSLDLYLMGLLPPASVPPFVVTTAPIGDIVHGAIVPGTVVTVDDVIASGPRVPPAAPG